MQLDLAHRRADLSPDRPAVFFRGRWYTYAELNRRAQQLAAQLAARGVRRGDRVSIVALNHLAHVDLALAAPKLGFLHAPFNYRLSADEQRDIAAYLEPRLVLHDARHASLARATGAPLLSLDDYEPWLAAAGAPPPAPALTPEDIHMLLLTGGSTGTPKAAMLPYRQIHANAVNTAASWGVTADDCVIQCTPAFHAAFNVFATPLLHLGGCIVLQEQFQPEEYLALAQQHRCTLMFMVPTMFQMLAEHPRFAETRLEHVRWAISGGAPCPDSVRQRFAPRGIHFRQGYGLTEAGVNCFTIGSADAERFPQSVGKPMPHIEAVLRQPDGTPVAQGQVGELTMRGPHLSLGYYKRPQETAELIRAGWLWTGDLARQNEEGLWFITGRRKEMYISGGENVYPVEIESAIYQLPEVAECAVLGVPHERWGECGLAAVALRPGAQLDAEGLRAALKKQLAGYKVPAHILFLPELPKSGAGKILKPEIRKQFERRALPH